ACPKGPSLDPAVKRLAVRVEDHPVDYREFEGVIPEGNYGAGAVIVWDRGYYRHPAARDRRGNEELLLEGLRKGDLKFVLEGEKLRGEFALVRTRKDEKSWLLLKKKDRHASREEVLAQNRSVASGRTLEDLLEAGAGKPTARKRADRVRVRETLEGEELTEAPKGPMPSGVRPMLATAARAPFDHPDWLFEVKWDGYRAVAEVRGGHVQLYSRNLLPLNERFSPIADALRECRFEAVLDGEVVAVDDQGHPDFQRLQDYPKSGGHLLYYVFDLLHFQGHDLTGLPLLRRKEILKRILPASSRLRFSDHVAGDGVLFFKVAKDKGLEGIVAKRGQSRYLPGKRSRQWLKVKAPRTQEAVIAGFTASRAGRPHFGSLVLGVYEGGELVCIGHAGGGFSGEALRSIHERLQPLIRERCPFRVEPRTNAPATWVRPELVCEVTFSGWTQEGFLRHPVFLRLREDKAPREVVRADGGEGA
ncbi:MAG: non-homologous end-joining DNA ligase, partial [Proteobacteria bacterium]|nr:non-homologous end-joining DNA ligase [Pseudomonadota bacterium]